MWPADDRLSTADSIEGPEGRPLPTGLAGQRHDVYTLKGFRRIP